MTIKRGILVGLTVLAIVMLGLTLLQSWSQPQFQSQLELYQTNLLLQATELRSEDPSVVNGRKALLGAEPVKAALEQYQEFQQLAQKNLERAQTLLKSSSTNAPQIQTSIPKLQQTIARVDLNLGILQVQQNQIGTAQTTWQQLNPLAEAQPELQPLNQTAMTLAGLWGDPPQLMPEAEQQIKKHLNGWFRLRALSQLYQLQQRDDALAELQAEEQAVAEQALASLAIVAGIPAMGCVIGVGILVVLLVQWLIQRKQALLAPSNIQTWTTPWDAETVWQVLIFGFFLIGQILLPYLFPPALRLLYGILGIELGQLGEPGKAFVILANYVLLAAGGLLVLYLSIKPFLPLPEGWFRVNWKGNWLFWGIGGYFAALPLVIVVSLVNQQIWQGHGGSNPILPIALEGRDRIALTVFFITAAIAAPLFEELLFRGFLLPSLTRYLPIWGAITLSSLIFAIAHLSLSEVLPLTVLGMVLGFVYARSRNLLASMLLHSLWNTGTLLSLIVLGSSSS
jgi:membrane protease YdiL (CAAX protease family)